MVTIPQKIPKLADGSTDLAAWLTHFSHACPDGIAGLQKTAEFVAQASQGLTTFYGQSCLDQGLEMADILLNMRLDAGTAAAALVTGTARLRQLKPDILTEAAGEFAAALVQKVLLVDTLDNRDPRGHVQTDRLRKAFVAMAGDMRAVLIRLAERVCIMRGIRHIHPAEQARIARETMAVYAPLASRLGIGQLKWELEDTAFHFMHPDLYHEIATFLSEKRKVREQRIEQNRLLLKTALSEAGIDAKIYGRAKHIYSIYRKSQCKHMPYEQIYDCSAMRLIVNTPEDCYAALGITHAVFHQLPTEFDDYISHPKSNGYRSIHTAVTDTDGKILEIQIRTQQMHEEAEHGIAAHWLYKETRTVADSQAARRQLLRQLLAWQGDVVREQNMPAKWAQKTVYVFTPAGEIIDLPVGATPLDFAYHIHTDLGHRCRGAKINGHIVPLTRALQTGDHAEIMTAAEGGPSRDWLNRQSGYLLTSRARSKVAHWLRQHDRPAETAKSAKKPARLPVSDKDEKSEKREKNSATEKAEKTEKSVLATQVTPIRISGVSDLLTRIARCCMPTEKDHIVGYITRGRGISIHRDTCNNVIAAGIRDGDRVIPVAWDTGKTK